MKPKPFASLNHFTVPVAIYSFLLAVGRRLPFRTASDRSGSSFIAGCEPRVDRESMAGCGLVPDLPGRYSRVPGVAPRADSVGRSPLHPTEARPCRPLGARACCRHMPSTRIHSAALRGWGRLASDATLGLTAIVEGMHRNVSPIQRLLGSASRGRTAGLTGVVYGSIRGITQLVGIGFDAAAARYAPAPDAGPSPEGEVARGILNGVVGDHLAATRNPLALPMELRHAGQPLPLCRRTLRARLPRPGAKVLVLVHGLCATDQQWARAGHDHGAALARDLGYVPIYLRYNTGLHVSTNGRSFAWVLERLIHAWPRRPEELTILAHSKGGLVARSACHAGAVLGHSWLQRLG